MAKKGELERFNIAGFEDRGRGHEPTNMGNLYKLEETKKKKSSLLEPPERDVALVTP